MDGFLHNCICALAYTLSDLIVVYIAAVRGREIRELDSDPLARSRGLGFFSLHGELLEEHFFILTYKFL